MKAIKVFKQVKAKERHKLSTLAFSQRVKPATLDEVVNYQVDNILTIELFKENIGKLFPLVLSLVSEGNTLRSIELLMGFKPRSLEDFLMRNRRMLNAVREARKLRSDKKIMDKIEASHIID